MNDDSALNDLLADFEEAQPAAAGSRSSSTPGHDRGYRSALDEQQTDQHQIAKATGKAAAVAGQYVRRSFTYRPDQLASIERLAEQLGLSQNDLVRWFTDMGIEAIEQGKEPPLAEVVRKKYDPHLGDR